jgi:hypothetical protein
MQCDEDKIEYIQGKIQAPPSNHVIWIVNTKFQTQEGSNQNTSFLNGKTHTPPETKANKNKRQTKPKMPTALQTKPYR